MADDDATAALGGAPTGSDGTYVSAGDYSGAHEATGLDVSGRGTSGSSGSSDASGNSAGDKVAEVADKAKDVAGAAKQQAGGRVRQVVDERSTQAGEQVRSVTDALRQAGDKLRQDGNEPHAKAVNYVADRSGQVADYLTRSSGDTILSDAEGLARRQPWLVIAGGLVAGVAAARFLRASAGKRRVDDRGGA